MKRRQNKRQDGIVMGAVYESGDIDLSRRKIPPEAGVTVRSKTKRPARKATNSSAPQSSRRRAS